jgi:hypothetical protein
MPADSGGCSDHPNLEDPDDALLDETQDGSAALAARIAPNFRTSRRAIIGLDHS